MNNQSATETPRRTASSFGRLFGVPWRWAKRHPLRFALLCLAAVIAGFYAEEDWRGARAWKQYQTEAAARGLSLDYATFIPKPVPDDENFAATLYMSTFMHPGGAFLTRDLYDHAADNVTGPLAAKEKGRRHFTDLVAWQQAAVEWENGELHQKFSTDKTDLASRAAAAPKVLEGLQPNAGLFAQLRAGSTRKYSRFPIAYNLDQPWLTLLPHLAPVRRTCEHLSLKACAELAAGQSDEALADVKLMLALADSVKTEPALISFLVRMICVQTTIQPVWEGLAEHGWTDAQLQELQASFSAYNFLADLDHGLGAERGFGTLICNNFGSEASMLYQDLRMNGDDQASGAAMVLKAVGWLFPSGWDDFEKLNYNRAFDEITKDAFDPALKTVSPSHAQTVEEGKELFPSAAGLSPAAILQHRVMSSFMTGTLGRYISRAAPPQVAVEQAALACDLERYRLGNGQFPETLDALIPQFIARAPNDVITGKPYQYRRTADGQFILYSVGWNGKDDGGVPGDSMFDMKKGDWVWEYPSR